MFFRTISKRQVSTSKPHLRCKYKIMFVETCPPSCQNSVGSEIVNLMENDQIIAHVFVFEELMITTPDGHTVSINCRIDGDVTITPISMIVSCIITGI